MTITELDSIVKELSENINIKEKKEILKTLNDSEFDYVYNSIFPEEING